MLMNYEKIIFEKRNHNAKITLNRPQAVNAIIRRMVVEIGNLIGLDD
jgi:enoyl-CoA hydratase/carnithine racemase